MDTQDTSYRNRATSNRSAQGNIPATSSDAPRPISDEASKTGEFKTLTQDMIKGGKRPARTTAPTRPHLSDQHPYANRAPRTTKHPTKRTRALIVGAVCAALVVILLVVLGNTLGAPSTSLENSPSLNNPIQVENDPSKTIEYDNYDYYVEQNENGEGFSLIRAREGDTPLALFALTGSPAALILYNGTFIIPENLDNGYDVLTWTIGDSTDPAKLSDAPGEVAAEEGSISSATIQGDTLTLNVDGGPSRTVPLT